MRTRGNWRMLWSFNKMEMMIEVCVAITTKSLNWYKIDLSHTYHLMGQSSESGILCVVFQFGQNDATWFNVVQIPATMYLSELAIVVFQCEQRAFFLSSFLFTSQICFLFRKFYLNFRFKLCQLKCVPPLKHIHSLTTVVNFVLLMFKWKSCTQDHDLVNITGFYGHIKLDKTLLVFNTHAILAVRGQ